jgi:hypothetical protein
LIGSAVLTGDAQQPIEPGERGRLSKRARVLRRDYVDPNPSGGVMSQYMLLVYHEELDEAGQAEREAHLPLFVELHRSLREAGLLKSVRALRSVESATSVRVHAGDAEIVDGPFAVTKEVLAGYYLVDCADLDEALRLAARIPAAGWGTIEVRPVIPPEEWIDTARHNGAEVTDADVAAMG